MDTNELNDQLIAVGEKLRAKGWATVGIDIYVSYLAALDLKYDRRDRMIAYRPSIRATAHRADGSFYGNGSSQEYVRDSWDIKSIDAAVARLHETADAMPTMADEAARIDNAKEKLTASERRLLGVR